MAKKQNEPDEKQTPVMAYIDDSLVREIDELAKKERRSRSAQIGVLIEEALTARAETAATK